MQNNIPRYKCSFCGNTDEYINYVSRFLGTQSDRGAFVESRFPVENIPLCKKCGAFMETYVKSYGKYRLCTTYAIASISIKEEARGVCRFLDEEVEEGDSLSHNKNSTESQ